MLYLFSAFLSRKESQRDHCYHEEQWLEGVPLKNASINGDLPQTCSICVCHPHMLLVNNVLMFSVVPDIAR